MRLRTYLNSLFDYTVTTEEITPERKARVNDMFAIYWNLVAPKPSYKNSFDRQTYQIIYTADRFGLLEPENSVKAKDYLEKFHVEDIKKMQIPFVTQSETQDIIGELVKKLYPDVEEEVLLEKFYVVDLYVPSKKLCLEVQGPYHYCYSGQPTMKTAVKAKILSNAGYTIRHLDAMKVLRIRNQYGTKDETRALRVIENQISFLTSSSKPYQ